MKFELSEASYLAFSRFIQDKIGMVLSSNKQYLVRSRLSSIARSRNYTCINAFLNDLIREKDPALTERCIELMTTNETYWFRDNYPYKLLESTILPAINKRQNKLRIWSSACASGQEPYSIAMAITQYRDRFPGAFPNGVQIVATDLSSEMVEKAKAGIYDQIALSRGLEEKYRTRFFKQSKSDEYINKMEIINSIKKMVHFKRFNLLNDFNSMGKFDIIFCRNVLIYFDGKQKVETLKKFAACLSQSDALILGASESITGVTDIFRMQNVDKSLYFTKL